MGAPARAPQHKPDSYLCGTVLQMNYLAFDVFTHNATEVKKKQICLPHTPSLHIRLLILLLELRWCINMGT